MATGRVETNREIFLNGHYYPLRGPVLRQVANQFAQKTVIGEYTEASDPALSAITWSDLRLGLGRHIFSPTEPNPTNRFWTGNVNVEYAGHIFPQSHERKGEHIFGSTSGYYTYMADYRDNSTLFATYATLEDGSSYGISAIGASIVAFQPGSSQTSSYTDLKSGVVGDLRILAAPDGTKVRWTRSDVSDTNWYTDSSENIKYVAFWRGMMWGANDSGELFFTPDASSTAISWTAVARASVQDSLTVTGLTTGPSLTEDHENLYLIRSDGFDRYNNAVEEFDRIFKLPNHPQGGKGFDVFHESLYYSQGLAVWRWTPTTGAQLAEPIGFDLEDGVPASNRGFIQSMTHTLTHLYVQVQGTDSTLENSIYRWNPARGAWSLFGLNGTPATTNGREPAQGRIHATGAYSFFNDDLRLFAGWQKGPGNAGLTLHNPIISYRLPSDLSNPALVNDTTQLLGFTNSAEVVTPWIKAEANQNWVAFKIEGAANIIPPNTAATDSTQLVIEYGLNFNDDSWTEITRLHGASDSNHAFSAALKTTAEPVGIPFDAFRIRTRFISDTGAADDHAYDLTRLSLVFEKRPKLRYLFSFDIDLTNPNYKGYSAKQLREFLDEFYVQATLGEFTYSDEDPGGGRTYYVRAINPVSQEETGQVERDVVRMQLLELG